MKIEAIDKKSASLVTLTNEVGFSLTLCDFGAGIYKMDWEGVPLTIEEDALPLFLKSSGYFGKTAGRIAGRIKKGELVWEGKTYHLGINDGKNSLHGGPLGLSFVKWKRDILTREGETYCDFYYHSPDGEMGYPGAVTFRVSYHLYENEPKVEILFKALSDVATPINLTTHTYFNLGGAETILDHVMSIKSHENEFYDSEMIPIGMKSSPHCLDFSIPKKIGRDIRDPLIYQAINKGYDHSFLLNPHDPDEPVLTLSNGRIRFELATDYPCLQIYSDNYPRTGVPLSNGRLERENSGVAIEPVEVVEDLEKMATVPGHFKTHRIVYSFYKETE
jgi:Galactose mutarotase and related enzymes